MFRVITVSPINPISVYKIIILIFKHFSSFPSFYLSVKICPSSYLVSCALNPFLPTQEPCHHHKPFFYMYLRHVFYRCFPSDLNMLSLSFNHVSPSDCCSFPTLDSKPIFSKKWSILVFIVSFPIPFQLLD